MNAKNSFKNGYTISKKLYLHKSYDCFIIYYYFKYYNTLPLFEAQLHLY